MKLRITMMGLLAAAALLAADVTGTWTFAVQTSAGSGSPTFVLKQDGEALGGTYSGALGEAKVTGTVKGNDVYITFTVDAGGDTAKVEYTGVLDGDKKIKGKVKMGTFAEGTFTGEKK